MSRPIGTAKWPWLQNHNKDDPATWLASLAPPSLTVLLNSTQLDAQLSNGGPMRVSSDAKPQQSRPKPRGWPCKRHYAARLSTAQSDNELPNWHGTTSGYKTTTKMIQPRGRQGWWHCQHGTGEASLWLDRLRPVVSKFFLGSQFLSVVIAISNDYRERTPVHLPHSSRQ